MSSAHSEPKLPGGLVPEDLLAAELLAMLEAVTEFEDKLSDREKPTHEAISPHGGPSSAGLARPPLSTTPDHSPSRQRKRARKDGTSTSYPSSELPKSDGGDDIRASRPRSSLPESRDDPSSSFSHLNDTNKSIYLQQQHDQLLLIHQDCHLKRSQAQLREQDLEAKLRASNLYCQQITESAQADLKGLVDQLSDHRKEYETLRQSMLEQGRKEEELDRRHSGLQVQHTLALAERDASQRMVHELRERLRAAGSSVQAKDEELRALELQVAKDQEEKEAMRRTGALFVRGKTDAEKRVKVLEAAEKKLKAENVKLADAEKRGKRKRREDEEALVSLRRARETERLALTAERNRARRDAAEAAAEVKALREEESKAEKKRDLMRESRELQDVMWAKHCREMSEVRVKEEFKVKEEPVD